MKWVMTASMSMKDMTLKHHSLTRPTSMKTNKARVHEFKRYYWLASCFISTSIKGWAWENALSKLLYIKKTQINLPVKVKSAKGDNYIYEAHGVLLLVSLGHTERGDPMRSYSIPGPLVLVALYDMPGIQWAWMTLVFLGEYFEYVPNDLGISWRVFQVCARWPWYFMVNISSLWYFFVFQVCARWPCYFLVNISSRCQMTLVFLGEYFKSVPNDLGIPWWVFQMTLVSAFLQSVIVDVGMLLGSVPMAPGATCSSCSSRLNNGSKSWSEPATTGGYYEWDAQ